jgi:N-acetylneuraminate synthase/N,N'-diacetyllegionaminate synthase
MIKKDGQIFIIAEAGVNHNGSLDKALELCKIAKDSGADAVKFQTWKTEELVLEKARQANYQKINTGFTQSQYQMLKELELSFNDFYLIKTFCDSIGIEFLSTPDEVTSLKFLVEDLGLTTIKVGSGELANLPYLREISNLAEKVILSTGMHSIEDVANSVNIFKEKSNIELILLQCTSSYPCPYEALNLKVMQTYSKLFKCKVGFSDHSIGLMASLLAASFGANVIEKHFTKDKNQKGPDHFCSLDPGELKDMITNIRLIPTILGSNEKSIQECEMDARLTATKVIVASNVIKKGQVFNSNNISLIRAGAVGHDGTMWDSLIGSKSNRDYLTGDVIKD